MTNQLSIKGFFNSPIAQQKLGEILGKNAASFTTSVLQVVNSNDMLKNADPQTVFSAALMAATLNLPINNNLGFAYIVPFRNNKANRTEAQFQLGYKGFIQLAQRTGQFKRINACAVYEHDTEQDVYNRLTSLLPKPPSGEKTGYIAYFQLLNGYEAHLSMSMEELNAHAQKYSQTAKKGFGVWKDNFDAMAQKTVIKLLLSKQAPLSIDTPLATAIQADQSVIVDGEYRYTDNEQTGGQLAVTDEQMPQILALTSQMSQDEIFGRYDLNFEQAQQVAAAYQQQVHHVN
ncbi:recombinase RecT [Moraxella sp. ZY200743]|uniref:recombinase RecT n=1 Tax=Moraxella sp. ZY200743 TaxID=2911970 RepID=UPI003D7D4B3D